jgi:O-acetyl-ADP-ribose deacetylase (regulator of RNase III)
MDKFDQRISIYRDDITKLTVDAIVNAANSTLLGGGGVDGAIHRAAGPSLLEECRLLNGCETGDAKATKAYNLSNKFVIHTVGPVYKDGKSGEAEKLTSCYKRSLEVALELGVTSIAFPAISTGVYGYPKEEAASIALKTVNTFLKGISQDSIENVIFVSFDKQTYAIYEKFLGLSALE